MDGVTFVSGEGYNIKSDRFVIIPSIGANSSIILNATYTVGNDVLKAMTNTVKINGALATNNNELDTTRDYKASVNFVVSNINLTINKQNNNGNTLTGAEYKLYSDSNATNEISHGLEFILNPNTTYYLKESKAPTGYQISTSIIPINVSNTGVITITDHTVSGSNGNYTVVLTDNEINILPNTGGIGTYIYILGGLCLVIFSAIGCYLYIKRKGKK